MGDDPTIFSYGDSMHDSHSGHPNGGLRGMFHGTEWKRQPDLPPGCQHRGNQGWHQQHDCRFGVGSAAINHSESRATWCEVATTTSFPLIAATETSTDAARMSAPPKSVRAACTNTSYAVTTSTQQRGWRWGDGRPYFVAFMTVLPPNSASCTYANRDDQGGCYSASSNHPGGANGGMADGSVRFISETIDSGFSDETRSSKRARSPYGVWGALGSIKGSEPVGEF